jgi:hypothetical protein
VVYSLHSFILLSLLTDRELGNVSNKYIASTHYYLKRILQAEDVIKKNKCEPSCSSSWGIYLMIIGGLLYYKFIR